VDKGEHSLHPLESGGESCSVLAT